MKVKLFGIPHFGREDEPYNNTKGKVYFVSLLSKMGFQSM